MDHKIKCADSIFRIARQECLIANPYDYVASRMIIGTLDTHVLNVAAGGTARPLDALLASPALPA